MAEHSSPRGLLAGADRQIKIARWMMDGRPPTPGIDPASELDPDTSDPAADAAGGPRDFENAAVARHNALCKTTGSAPLVQRLLKLSQQALALHIVDSGDTPNVPLAARHHDLGKLYLSLGWPTAALAQSDKARDVNKLLLAEEDLTDEVVSDTEGLHPRILLLNAQAHLSLGNGKKARSGFARACNMTDILYPSDGSSSARRHVSWVDLLVFEGYLLASEGDIDSGFDCLFKALEVAELAHGRAHERVAAVFTDASKLCMWENDEEEALEYARKGYDILLGLKGLQSRLVADAALRCATLAAVMGKVEDAKPLFRSFADGGCYESTSLVKMAADRWHDGKDTDGLDSLARIVLGRRRSGRAGAGGERNDQIFADFEAPGVAFAWGKTAMLTAIRTETSDRVRKELSAELGEAGCHRFQAITQKGPDDCAESRVNEDITAASKSSKGRKSQKPAWGSNASGVGSSVSTTPKPNRAKSPGSSSSRRGSVTSQGSGTDGEDSSLPASAPDTPGGSVKGEGDSLDDDADIESTALQPLLMPSAAERKTAFNRMDYNGNGGLSLAEIDKAVIEIWPKFNHKPALMRAYKAADKSGDGFITRNEFKKLLHYLVYFNELWHKFERIDTDGDRRLSREEFGKASALVGHRLSSKEADKEFASMDSDGYGMVLFDEFCAWCARRHHAVEAFGPEEEEEPKAKPKAAREPEPEGSDDMFEEVDSEDESERRKRRDRYAVQQAWEPVSKSANQRQPRPQSARPASARVRSSANRNAGRSPGRSPGRGRPNTARPRATAGPRSQSSQRPNDRTKVSTQLGSGLEAANLEIRDEVSFAKHANERKNQQRRSADISTKKDRLNRLAQGSARQRPTTAPGGGGGRGLAGVSARRGDPKTKGPKLSAKEMASKLQDAKLKNLLRRIRDEAELGPNYMGVTKINPLDFYDFGEEIGHGAFGKVRVATHLLTGMQVAIATAADLICCATRPLWSVSSI